MQPGPECGAAVRSPSYYHICSSSTSSTSSAAQQQLPSRNSNSHQLHPRVKTALLPSVNQKRHSLSICGGCRPKYELPLHPLLQRSVTGGDAGAFSSRFHRCKKGRGGRLIRDPRTVKALAADGNGRTSYTSKPSEMVVCFGELLIDFVPTVGGLSLANAPAFKKAPGGAPANVAVGIARLGGTSAFMGKVGDDEFGYMLVDILKENSVESRGVRFDPNARTALAFVTLREDGEREFMFYRNPSADMLLTADEVDIELVQSAQIFHYGSISLITDPCRTAHMAAMEAAKTSGTLLSYDPNLRLPLWESAEAARTKIKSIWDQADMIKVSEEEIAFLTEGGDPYSDEAAMQLWHPNLKLLLVTEGPGGCRYYGKNFHGRVPGLKVTPVDTTGAGDAFVAGLLSQIVRDMSLLEDEQKLREALKFANACGAIATTERGAIPALPDKEAVLQLLSKVTV